MMRSSLEIGVAIICLALVASTGARSETIQYHPNSPVYIGGNYDPTYPGRAYPECLVRTSVRAESILPGQTPGTAAATQFQLTRVKTRRELYRLLNISMSLSGSYGLFSADASGSLEQENTFSEETFTWVISGFTHFGKFILNDVLLNPSALTLQNNPVGFRNRCGTDYAQIELRAVQATAIFTIKNLSESERKTLEASFNASYGGSALALNAGGKYSEFIKTAAQFGQIEVRVNALGGPGVSALAPIITTLDKPDEVLKIIQKYFEALTLNQSVPVSYQTGSLQSLINKPQIETDFYNRFVSDVFEQWENLGAEQSRLRAIAQAPDDWAISVPVQEKLTKEIAKITALRRDAVNTALDCKSAFNNVAVNAASRRAKCQLGQGMCSQLIKGTKTSGVSETV